MSLCLFSTILSSFMSDFMSVLQPYLKETECVELNEQGLPSQSILSYSAGMRANIEFLENPEWRQYYFESHHRAEVFRDRWMAVTGSWDGKVVVDIGCGPGNVYATMGGEPGVIIGVDISPGALQMATGVGYVPLLADAHNLPLVSGFADVVVMNATLHHCDDMARVLAEGARLVKPGGVLLTDQDPQRSAWEFKGMGLWIRQVRFPLYWLMRSPHYLPGVHRTARYRTEIHNQKAGDGLSREIYEQVLERMGFEWALYPHNHDLGREVLAGAYGRGSWRYRLSQRLSGIDERSAAAAQSFMCVARVR